MLERHAGQRDTSFASAEETALSESLPVGARLGYTLDFSPDCV